MYPARRRELRALVVILGLLVAPLRGRAQQSAVATRPAAHTSLVETAPCAGIADSINFSLHLRAPIETDNPSEPLEILRGTLRAAEMDCSAAPFLDSQPPLELKKVFFDRRLHSWEFLLRCASTTDCVPFLVRWPQPRRRNSVSRTPLNVGGPPGFAFQPNSWGASHFLLRPGQAATLVWDQDGIRAVLPAICLERGNVGDKIRVRVKSGSRVIEAEIVNESLVRANL